MLFVLRLLPPNRKVATLLIFVLFFLNFAITLIAGVSYGVHCIPFRASWDNVPGAKCEPDQLITKTQQVNGGKSSTFLVPESLSRRDRSVVLKFPGPSLTAIIQYWHA